MKLKLTKGLFAAVMAAFVAAPAMAEVTFDKQSTIGASISMGDWVDMPATQIALTINLSALQNTATTTDIVLTKSPSKTDGWGLRTADGTTIYGEWDGDYQKNNPKVTFAQLQALDTESTGSIQVMAEVGVAGTYLRTMGGTDLYSNSGLKSSTYPTTAYKITDSGIVTAANAMDTTYSNLGGSGTWNLTENTTIKGGGNTDIIIDLSGKSAVFAGNTTLNKIGAYGAASGGITVKSGITLTAAIDSSWNPGHITLEDDAKIEADHITLSTNAVSNVTGAGIVHVSGNVETFNGGKINTSADTFTVDGDVILGSKQAGANNDALTVSGGAFSVAGTTTVNSGRTLTVSGGTATLNDLVIAGGTVNLTGGTTTIDGTVTVNGGTLNMTTATDLTMESVTLNAGNTITLGTDHSGKLTTTALTVNGASTINADLILAQGAEVNMTAAVTMGCTVTIEGGTVLTVADTVMTAPVTLFTDVEGLTLGTTEITEMGWYDANGILASVNGTAITGDGQFVIGFWDGTVSVAEASVPEPATATLSLLALAALAARRRRH